jgi:hypothetical protein
MIDALFVLVALVGYGWLSNRCSGCNDVENCRLKRKLVKARRRML